MHVNSSLRVILLLTFMKIWRPMVRLCKNNIDRLEDGFLLSGVEHQIAKTLEIPMYLNRYFPCAGNPFANVNMVNQFLNGFPV